MDLQIEARQLHSTALAAQLGGELAKAEIAFDMAVGVGEEAFGPDHPWLANVLINAASVYRACQRKEDEVRAIERAYLIVSRIADDPDHWRLVKLGRRLREAKAGFALAV